MMAGRPVGGIFSVGVETAPVEGLGAGARPRSAWGGDGTAQACDRVRQVSPACCAIGAAAVVERIYDGIIGTKRTSATPDRWRASRCCSRSSRHGYAPCSRRPLADHVSGYTTHWSRHGSRSTWWHEAFLTPRPSIVTRSSCWPTPRSVRRQCEALRAYVARGGGLWRRSRVSRYDEQAAPARLRLGMCSRRDAGGVDGPMKNSYLTREGRRDRATTCCAASTMPRA